MKENFALGKVVVNHHALYHGLPRGQCGGQDKKKKRYCKVGKSPINHVVFFHSSGWNKRQSSFGIHYFTSISIQTLICYTCSLDTGDF